ncbi:MAG: 2-oxoglutarate dehydrogenase E1 component [Bdellovibrionales bacterium]
MSLEQSSFLYSANAEYIAAMFRRYQENPASVEAGWQAFFASLGVDTRSALEDSFDTVLPATEDPTDAVLFQPPERPAAPMSVLSGARVAASVGAFPDGALLDSIRAIMLIRVYRVRGHLLANLDPLNLAARPYPSELNPKTYGFSEQDMDRPIYIDGMLGFQSASLRQILARLQATYCSTIGVEFMHIQDPGQKAWIQERIEQSQNRPQYDGATKRRILKNLTQAEAFEKFLATKFVGVKRFGLEGGEAMIPALDAAIARAASQGLREVVIGMAHRGRLNMLTNVLGKPFTAMFAQFHGAPSYPDSVHGSGDVKYHLGAAIDRDFNGQRVYMSMSANPSHLEWVNPVVEGRVRAKQQQRAGATRTNDEAMRRVMALLIHGDAAFAGQGIVAETLMLSELKGYRTGGTLHFVINNQVGFTTGPKYARSGVYCTDVAKMIQAPIFHVNGDDVESVVHVAELAAEFRQKFRKDIVIDMVCYRRHGHNEGDEPAFTQPVMYRKIKGQPTTREVYARKLAQEGAIPQAESDQVNADFVARLERDFDAAKNYTSNKTAELKGRWQGLSGANANTQEDGTTGIAIETLRELGAGLTRIPDGFQVNPKIARLFEAKRKMFESGEGFDWATAESLAFASLLTEGTPVRLSGQDCSRGTFSQRHSMLFDQEDGHRYAPLNSLSSHQASYEVHDSPLSEAAVMGFDYGFSLAEPQALVCWEGQFGDFANTAQVYIDQFLASSETKWQRMSGLTLLLPHGYEGQGPEHSSANLARYLMLCAENNMQVANCSTPGNYFHILRRQVRRNFRKPLILMTPKSLLRHKLCVSPLDEMATGTMFRRVIGEAVQNAKEDAKITRVVLCSGKVYYDLFESREQRKLDRVALVRLEQFYPFPDQALAKELARYANADVVWCQEESMNYGAWYYLDRRLENVLASIKHRCRRPLYAGRPESAAPSTGSLKRHNQEQSDLMDMALSVG